MNSTVVPRSLSVLVVDDDANAADVTVRELVRYGFAARGVAGAGAAADATADPPDVILLDPVMHGVDGHAVTQLLREKVAGRRPLMIGLTVDAVGEHLLRAADRGFDLYLTKPAIPAVLVGVLSRFRRMFDAPSPTDRLNGLALTPVLPATSSPGQGSPDAG